jgi:two-component system chemotaxis response regulator CheY
MFNENTRVLIIDDMNTMRQLVKGQVRAMGFKNIQEAENGEAGFKILAETHKAGAPIELILSDWNMPVMTGIDLLKKVRATAEYKNVPFMLITAEGESSQVMEAIKSGVSNYVVKPFTPAVLQEKLLAVWKKHNPGK